jgi:hypothetical protein
MSFGLDLSMAECNDSWMVLAEGKFGYGLLIVGVCDLEFCLVWVSQA